MEPVIARVIHQGMVEMVAAEMVQLVHIILDHQVHHLQAVVVVVDGRRLAIQDILGVVV